MILRLIEPTSGKVIFDGKDITAIEKGRMKPIRREMQIVFQNPLSSLSPRLRVEQIIAEPLTTHGVLWKEELRPRVIELLEQVGLGKEHLDRFPHELSGGQCQRVAVARALALNPKLIVLDEPSSSCDRVVGAGRAWQTTPRPFPSRNVWRTMTTCGGGAGVGVESQVDRA